MCVSFFFFFIVIVIMVYLFRKKKSIFFAVFYYCFVSFETLNESQYQSVRLLYSTRMIEVGSFIYHEIFGISITQIQRACDCNHSPYSTLMTNGKIDKFFQMILCYSHLKWQEKNNTKNKKHRKIPHKKSVYFAHK